MKNSRTPIGPAERDVLDHLEAYVDANADDEPLTRETAVAHLTEQGFGRVEASDRIKQLLLKERIIERFAGRWFQFVLLESAGTYTCERTFFRLGFPRSLRSLREPLGAKIYAKKAEPRPSASVQ